VTGILFSRKSLTTDSDWQVRRNAAKSLALHATAEAIPALGEALQDEHWQVRKIAAEGLQKVADERVLPNLVRVLSDECPDV
jgi:HEAT repeat protein